MVALPFVDSKSASGSSRPTVADVAREAGVSPMTVSRVVNGERWVSAETSARVRDAIVATGYRPSRSARDLRRGATGAMVGLVIDDISNPFYSAVAAAAETVARAQDAMLIVASFGESRSAESSTVRELFDRGADGIMLYSPFEDHRYLEEDRFATWPTIFLGWDAGEQASNSVLIDLEGGVRQAVRHLAQFGHRRIGIVAQNEQDEVLSGSRIGAYRRALTELGLEVDDALVRDGCRDSMHASEAVRTMLAGPRPPTALFTTNNRMTVGALNALGAGFTDVALVGFDDFDLAESYTPAITVVSVDPELMGMEAAKMLFARLDDGNAVQSPLRIPSRLIARGSGEIART